MFIEELPNFFRIEVPLPANPLRQLNAYVLRGADRSLLIDNGFNMPECEAALRDALRQLHVSTEKLDYFITHLHSDHCGLTGALAAPHARIYCGVEDGRRINACIENIDVWRKMLQGLAQHGFPEEGLDELFNTHPGKIYAALQPLDFTFVREGEVLAFGDYTFCVLSVAGHTPGHMALYETKKRFLISGDHILGTITPNITAWDGVTDALGDYLRSLDKIYTLPVGITYPGHREIVLDTRSRIDELREHHRSRLQETLHIVHKHGPSCAFAVAAQLRWSLKGSWEHFQVQQKCFAVGETVAHLDHLAVTGVLRREDAKGRVLYLET